MKADASRRLWTDIRVDTSVKAKDEDSAKAMAQTLTEVAINEELQNKGVLNKDEEAKMILVSEHSLPLQ